MDNNIDKKAGKKVEDEKKVVDFKDLSKKEQRMVLKQYWENKHPTRPIEPAEIEHGTMDILNLIEKNPGITRKEIIEKTKFVKKKVKRILKKNRDMIIECITQNKIIKLYYLGLK